MVSSGLDFGLTGFLPDPARASRVDGCVRGAVADSLGALFEVLEQYEIARPADRIVLERLRSGSVPPSVVALYADLAETVLRGELDGARPLVDQLLEQSQRRDDGFRIVNLTDNDLGDGQSARYERRLNDDPAAPIAIGPLTDNEFREAARHCAAALALLDAAAPELSGEIRGLIREVTLVRSRRADRSLGFQGASTFYLWGSLFLNAFAQKDRVGFVEGLAHEAAHMLLFGMGLGKTLVENSREELYSSPLRVDPRPMEGIVHATYVLARMHYAASRLLESGLLTQAEHAEVAAAHEQHRASYAAGLSVLDAHARWTPVGEAAFAGARAYMDGAIHG